jgi:hypothetical protein
MGRRLMTGTVYPMFDPALAAGIVTVLSLRFAIGGFRAGLKSAAVIGMLELACGAGTGNWLMTGAGAVTLALALRGWRQHRPPPSARRARPGHGDRRQPGRTYRGRR